jgi:hypothetical protein
MAHRADISKAAGSPPAMSALTTFLPFSTYRLANMAEQTQEVLGAESLSVFADRGYYNGDEIRACDKLGITTYVPKTMTSGNQAKGLYGKQDFIYRAEDDEYECPAGERLIYRYTEEDKGKTVKKYWSSACPNCASKPQCTTGKNRRVSRWEHEAVMDKLESRMEENLLMMRVRKSTVEHPFGILKCWIAVTTGRGRTLRCTN